MKVFGSYAASLRHDQRMPPASAGVSGTLSSSSVELACPANVPASIRNPESETIRRRPRKESRMTFSIGDASEGPERDANWRDANSIAETAQPVEPPIPQQPIQPEIPMPEQPVPETIPSPLPDETPRPQPDEFPAQPAPAAPPITDPILPPLKMQTHS